VSQLQDAIARLDKMRPQERVEVVRGFQIRKKRNGIPVLSLHYSAIPERDPSTEEGKKWFKKERKLASSASTWNREQEIDAYAKGGEAVFAKILSDYYDVIVISDPNWYPKPEWDVVGGFDHGKRNATALLKGYVDRVNRYDWITKKPYPPDVYLCGEYYSMQRDGWDNSVRQNVAEIKKMPDLERMRWIKADPSIFPDTQTQGDTGEYESINNTYVKCGFKKLTPYEGVRSDTTFAEWMLSDFWGGVEDNIRPRLFIVCRNPSDRPQPGLHPYDCPNLLWELKRAKRVELSARQLSTKNQSDALVDKDNHIRDAMKYLTGTVRVGAAIPIEDEIKAQIEHLDPTTASIRAAILVREKIKGGYLGVDGRWIKKAAPTIPIGRRPMRRG
jgi:hypothetical protein